MMEAKKKIEKKKIQKQRIYCVSSLRKEEKLKDYLFIYL